MVEAIADQLLDGAAETGVTEIQRNRVERSIDVVLFDVDDTLWSTTGFAETARRGAVRAMIEAGLQADEETAVGVLAEIVDERSSNYGKHFDRLVERLGAQSVGVVPPSVIVAAGVVAYHHAKEQNLRLLPDARELLAALHVARVRVGILTDGLQVKQAEKLVRLAVLPYLDPSAIFFAEQLGMRKPNPKLFSKACELLGTSARRVLYVGDRPDHDITPAAAAGMKTVLYRGADGRYSALPAGTPPHHAVEDLRALIPLLRDLYGISFERRECPS